MPLLWSLICILGRRFYRHGAPNRAFNFSIAGRAIVFSLFLLSGCRSTEPQSASFASVVIHERTTDEICRVTAQVFREDGYQILLSGPAEMRFEKEGTRAQSLAYGSLGSAQKGAAMLVRVKANIIYLESGSQRLQCEVFIINNGGDRVFEDEIRLPKRKAGPYQKMLNEVKGRLK